MVTIYVCVLGCTTEFSDQCIIIRKVPIRNLTLYPCVGSIDFNSYCVERQRLFMSRSMNFIAWAKIIYISRYDVSSNTA